MAADLSDPNSLLIINCAAPARDHVKLAGLMGKNDQKREKGDENKADEDRTSGNRTSSTCVVAKESDGASARVESVVGSTTEGSSELPDQPESTSSPPKANFACRKHGMIVSRYCYDCNSILCVECFQVVHRDHVWEDVALAANRCREVVNEHLKHMRSIQGLSKSSLEAVEARKAQIFQESETATKEINRQFDDMVFALQERRDALLDRLAELSVGKMRSLCEQEQALISTAESVEDITARVERALDVLENEELVSMQRQLEALMSQEAAKHAQIPPLPVEVPDIVVDIKCLEEVKRICQAGAQVYRSNFCGEGTAVAVVGKEARFSLRSSVPVPHPAGIKAVLVSLVESSIVLPMRVSCHEHSRLCQVTYTPKIRGRHQICVEENGKPVVGCPMEVFVSIELSQMGSENRNMGVFQCPTALDFSSKDLAFISQRDTDHIAVRTRQGKKVQDMKNMRFKNCWGISLDLEDNIYVTSSNYLSKFSSDGRFIKTIGGKGTQGGEFDSPRGMCVIGKKLYVCDRDNSRVQVFNMGLQLVDVIANKATRWATGIASTSDGRLYIIGQGTAAIQMFSSEHVYTGCIHHNDLSYPAGICFNPIRQQLFVVDCDSSGTSVFVFELDGQFVTRLNVEGSSGVCYGIAVDRDGFVYVCDGSKNIIHTL